MEIAKAVKSMGGTISRFEEERMDLQHDVPEDDRRICIML